MKIAEECTDYLFGNENMSTRGDHGDKNLTMQSFDQCCAKAVESFGPFQLIPGESTNVTNTSWTGCSCQMNERSSYICSVYGDKRTAHIRLGMYYQQLKEWFKYIHPSDILIYRSEDAFRGIENMD